LHGVKQQNALPDAGTQCNAGIDGIKGLLHRATPALDPANAGQTDSIEEG